MSRFFTAAFVFFASLMGWVQIGKALVGQPELLFLIWMFLPAIVLCLAVAIHVFQILGERRS